MALHQKYTKQLLQHSRCITYTSMADFFARCDPASEQDLLIASDVWQELGAENYGTLMPANEWQDDWKEYFALNADEASRRSGYIGMLFDSCEVYTDYYCLAHERFLSHGIALRIIGR